MLYTLILLFTLGGHPVGLGTIHTKPGLLGNPNPPIIHPIPQPPARVY
jgi:hypothetical protein